MFMVCMGCMNGIVKDVISPIQSPLTSGFAVATLIQIFGHVSDCHMNPAVTACFLVRGVIDIPTSIIYLIAELLGASIGYGLTRIIIPVSILAVNPGQCETQVHADLSNSGAAVFEFVITSVLIFLVCGLCDIRHSAKQDSAPIKFGLCIAGLSFVGGSLTGASLNPARSFGPAVWNWSWNGHWVYWAGPMSAGFIVPKFYQFLFEKDLKSMIEQ
uniref:Aquaporin n=1 Tax=Riptortus pedestris TaxID=329032 RepID=R4WQP0_RIPPE|nr:aquaporin [Riptortus pedestris]